MKDIVRMLAYTAIAIVMIALLIKAASSDIPAGMGVMLALLLVVVLPVVIVLTLVSRNKKTS
jgi:hypothetical protein